MKQFLPFITTLSELTMDLLIGIFIGLVVGVGFILIDSYKNSHALIVDHSDKGQNRYRISFAEEVTLSIKNLF